MSCLVRIILIKNIVLPVCTFVWSIYNRLVCVALQPAVPIDEVHHVLCRGDGGNVDGEALQGEKTGCGCLTLQHKLLKKKLRLWRCCAYLSGSLNVQVNESFAIVLRPALNLLDLFEVG